MPSRVLRQGDPLSPYLFIICAEGLLAMFREVEGSGGLYGIRVCSRSSSISHLLFADDSFFLFRATVEKCQRVDILNQYKAASG